MTTQSGFSPKDDTIMPADSARPDVGLLDILAAWWQARTRIVLLAMAGGVVAAAAFALVYAFRPVHQELVITFRLLFTGVEKDQYPNGTHFTPADIVATPVLDEVYRRNALGQYIEFDDFKAAFAVIDSNPAFDRLRRDFAARFDDHRLQPTDRFQLEDEYANRVKAIPNNEFALVGTFDSQFTRSLPGNLKEKVMNDILKVWAGQSKALGTFKFDVNILSDNIVQEDALKDADYLILTDRLRSIFARITKNLEDLGSLPGARLVRVGEHHISLGELQAAVQDSLNFRLSSIQGPIFAFGLYKNRTLAEIYVGEHLFQLQLEAQEIASQADSIQRALADYVASRPGSGRSQETVPSQGTGAPQTLLGGSNIIPQISDSFIDRVVNLSTQGVDVAFRQELSKQSIEIARKKAKNASDRQLYERMQVAISGTASATSGEHREEVLGVVAGQVGILIAELKSDLQNLQLLHQEISQRNLQPSMVYSIVLPFYQEPVSTVSMRIIGLLAGFIWCVFVGAILVIVASRAILGSMMSSRAPG